MGVWPARTAFFGLIAFGLFSVAARAGLTADEPFPALIGPSFGPVLWSDGSVLAEDAAVVAKVGRREVVVRVQRMVPGLPVPPRFVVRRWMLERPFDTKEGRAWVRKALKRAGVKGKVTSLALRWTQRPFDPRTRRWTGASRVTREQIFRL